VLKSLRSKKNNSSNASAVASVVELMANTSSVVFAGIAPHPPIMVPEVGRDAIVDVRSSIDAMAELTERVLLSGAETVILISPHAPLQPDAFVAYDGPQLHADFANFRAPTATVHAQLDDELLKEITRAAAEQNLSTIRIKGFDLDHGTAVPLYFLQRYGFSGSVVALGYSFLTNEDHLRFGRCIHAAIERVGRPVAFIASGDLSHRLKLEAPAGYNPQAHLFDEEVVDAIRSSSTNRIVELDPELRRMAGECGYRSMLVAIGVAQELEPACEVISYEAPFGVGYLVAQLFAGSADILSAELTEHTKLPTEATGAELPALARQVVETYVTSGQIIKPPEHASELLSQRAGCFVSIKTRAGELRGCIGTIDPAKHTLAEEVILNAISAATLDPRFAPVHVDELPELKYSVDVLSPPELTRLEDLDPRVYGVIVADENGLRRGLLLPGLEGIDTAARQVEIASRKAGILRGVAVRLWRFRADRYREEL
jgi:AmmeMemoRadiSam system protein A/AmmeMemoRadiSam system protein B